jgi:Transcriptional Coactivator p15 (PC4)
MRNPDIPIATIPCGCEETRVNLMEYRGHPLISIWRWYRQSNEMRPGKRGVTVPLARLPELAAAVGAALERARAEGLLPPLSENRPRALPQDDGGRQ